MSVAVGWRIDTEATLVRHRDVAHRPSRLKASPLKLHDSGNPDGQRFGIYHLIPGMTTQIGGIIPALITVDAVCALTPLYYELTPQVHADYFRRIAEASDVPVIAYHIPGRSGVRLSPDWFVGLAAEGVIAGVKYTSSDLHPLAEIRRRTDPGFVVLNGSDEVLLGGLALGADGGIGSTYNAIAGVYLALYRAFREGRWGEARARQDQANHVIDLMSRYPFLAFLRAMLGHCGVPTGESRGPLPTLGASQRHEIAHLVATDPILRSALDPGSTPRHALTLAPLR